MEQKSILIKNKIRTDITPLSISHKLPTRIVANIGLSPGVSSVEAELEKARIAVKFGADIVADLTITPQIKDMLKILVKEIKVPISTVPYYDAAIKALKERGSIVKVNERDILNAIEEQASIGVDIMTIHASLTREILNSLKKSKRIIEIPSRGGAWVAGHMIHENVENPMYENFDQILDILSEYNVTLSLGTSVRPGSVVDGLDEQVIMELLVQRQLVEKALKKGVQTIVEFGGHFPADVIPIAVTLAKKLCYGVPLRSLIIATDVAASVDHIAAAIAGAIAAMNSVEILVAISPAEHLGLPRLEDTIEGIMAFKVAAHTADIVKQGCFEKDRLMSIARKRRDWKSMWKYAIFGTKASELYTKLQRGLMESDHCTMCGSLCAFKILEQFKSGE
jgi:phosphomethylpyrimidine synthase